MQAGQGASAVVDDVAGSAPGRPLIAPVKKVGRSVSATTMVAARTLESILISSRGNSGGHHPNINYNNANSQNNSSISQSLLQAPVLEETSQSVCEVSPFAEPPTMINPRQLLPRIDSTYGGANHGHSALLSSSSGSPILPPISSPDSGKIAGRTSTVFRELKRGEEGTAYAPYGYRDQPQFQQQNEGYYGSTPGNDPNNKNINNTYGRYVETAPAPAPQGEGFKSGSSAGSSSSNQGSLQSGGDLGGSGTTPATAAAIAAAAAVAALSSSSSTGYTDNSSGGVAVGPSSGGYEGYGVSDGENNSDTKEGMVENGTCPPQKQQPSTTVPPPQQPAQTTLLPETGTTTNTSSTTTSTSGTTTTTASTSTNKASSSSTSNITTCEECATTFRNAGELRKHQKVSHQKQLYKCRKCGELFLSIADRQTHKNNKHFPSIETVVKQAHFEEFPEGSTVQGVRNSRGFFDCPSAYCTFTTRIPSYWYDHIRSVEHVGGEDPQKRKRRGKKS